MSEDIVKNYPGTTEGHGHTGEGAVASGSTADAAAIVNGRVGVMGNIAGANYGDAQLGVNPVGTPGGILLPEQARRFIDYVWDATVLAKDGRRVTMRANTMELEKLTLVSV